MPNLSFLASSRAAPEASKSDSSLHKDSFPVSKVNCMCIPKIHPNLPALTLCISLHPSLLRSIASESPQTARQQGPTGRKLLRTTESKPLGQSSSSSHTISLQLRSSTTPKDSFRFVANRPVDATSVFRRKTAPTPNDAKPRALLRAGASFRRPTHRVKRSAS